MTVIRLLVIFLLLTPSPLARGMDIFYVKSNAQLHEVQGLDLTAWKPYSNPIYEGLNNGIYWFKITLDPAIRSQVITIPESHINTASLYINGREIRAMKDTRYVTFIAAPNATLITCYLKVDCMLEARIPLKVLSLEQFARSEWKEFLVMGIYYGIVISILIINLFSFLSFGNRTYLFYMFMALIMALNAVYKDGWLYLIFGQHEFILWIEPTINSMLTFGSIFFTASYLGINHRTNTVYKAALVLTAITQCFNAGIFWSSGNLLWFAMTDVMILVTLDVFWSIGIFQWRRSFEAKVFTVAYGLPLLFAHGYYISPHFGFNFLNLPPIWYKIGSVFEMIIFTFAIMHKARRLSRENTDMRRKIIEFTNQLFQPGKSQEITTVELIENYRFTLKEIEVLKEIANQKTNLEIADKLYVSQNTVKYHVKNIFNKLEVNSRKEAGEKYLRFHTQKPTMLDNISNT